MAVNNLIGELERYPHFQMQLDMYLGRGLTNSFEVENLLYIAHELDEISLSPTLLFSCAIIFKQIPRISMFAELTAAME